MSSNQPQIFKNDLIINQVGNKKYHLPKLQRTFHIGLSLLYICWNINRKYYTTNHDDNIWYLFNIWDENIFIEWRLVVFRFYAYKFKVQFFVMSWKDEVIIPLIRMMTYNIYKTLSPKFLAHAVSLYPFVKNSIIFYSILDVSKISRPYWFRIASYFISPILTFI